MSNVQSNQPPTQNRSQLSQALTRNIATYYETQRKKSVQKNGNKSASGSGVEASAKSSAIILNDLSLNLDMLDDSEHFGGGGNVIVNNGSRASGQWVMLQTGATTITANAAQGEVDLEAYRDGQADFYRTRSLPWPQSSRGGAGKLGASSEAQNQQPTSASTTASSGSTTMGRVCFGKIV